MSKRTRSRPAGNGLATGLGPARPFPLVPPLPAVVPPAPAPTLRLDLGCGPNPREGFDGVDVLPFDGKVKHVLDLAAPVYAPLPKGCEHLAGCFDRKVIGYEPWPWADGSVAEIHASHFVEHLTALERCHFWNELCRVLAPGAKATIIVPHWASCRAYGDPSHEWPALGEFAWYYLSREWRLGNPAKGLGANAPHTDVSNGGPLSCDLEVTWGYCAHQSIALRNQEAQQFAFQFYKESISDMVVTMTRRPG